MNQSFNNQSPKTGPTSTTAPAESELKQFSRLLDNFFANVAI